MKLSWAMSCTRSVSRTIRPISRSMRRWYLTTSISNARTSPCLTRATSRASASASAMGLARCAWARSGAAVGRGAQGVPGRPHLGSGHGYPVGTALSWRTQTKQQPRAQVEHHGQCARQAIHRPGLAVPGQLYGPRRKAPPGQDPGDQACHEPDCGRHASQIGVLQGPDNQDSDGQGGQNGSCRTPPKPAGAPHADGWRCAHDPRNAGKPACRWFRQNRSCSSPRHRSS